MEKSAVNGCTISMEGKNIETFSDMFEKTGSKETAWYP